MRREAVPKKPFRDATEYAYLVTNIPDAMKQLPQWVCWELRPNNDGVLIKIPVTPDTGCAAKTNDPKTWRTFERAFEMFMQRERYRGLGFIFSADDNFFCVDLDHCIDAESGKCSDLAQECVNWFSTYTEISQSGFGLHIIGQGKKPEGAKCRNSQCNPGIEVYDKVRFLAITGNLWRFGGRDIQPCHTELYGFLKKHKLVSGDKNNAPTVDFEKNDLINPKGEDNSPVVLTDDDLLARMFANKRNGESIKNLWSGNTGEFNNDESAADQALVNHLAWWTNKDANRIDRLFRQSGLMRDKWNDRPDYRNRTISRAMADIKGGYVPRAKNKSKTKRQVKSDEIESTNTGNIPHFCAELRSLTDLGNAEWFISQFGSQLRYVTDSKTWLFWTGKRWEPDRTGEVERLVWESVKRLFSLMPNLDHDKRVDLSRHIKRTEAAGKLDAIIKLAAKQPGIPIQATDLDRDIYLINCQNGTVNLRTGKLQPHNPADNISKIVPANYNPGAKCCRWTQFLFEIFCGNQDLINFMHRLCGYALTGDTSEESVYILYGRGRCGKSKFVEVLRHVMGDYIKDTPVSTFVERNDTNTADLASLLGARLVTATEAEENQTFNEGLLKRVSGRDPVTCRYLYCGYFTYTPTFKVLFATNDVPQFKTQSFAMKARIKIVPFNQRFYDPEEGKTPVKDMHIIDKLKAETDGIFSWMVKGAMLWQQDGGLKIPQIIKDEVENLFGTRDLLGDFIENQCVLASNYPDLELNLAIKTNELWRAYQEYCTLQGIPSAFKKIEWFGRNLSQRDGIESVRKASGRFITGIDLLSNNPDLPCRHVGISPFSGKVSRERQENINTLPKNEKCRHADMAPFPDFPIFSDADFVEIEPAEQNQEGDDY